MLGNRKCFGFGRRQFRIIAGFKSVLAFGEITLVLGGYDFASLLWSQRGTVAIAQRRVPRKRPLTVSRTLYDNVAFTPDAVPKNSDVTSEYLGIGIAGFAIVVLAVILAKLSSDLSGAVEVWIYGNVPRIKQPFRDVAAVFIPFTPAAELMRQSIGFGRES